MVSLSRRAHWFQVTERHIALTKVGDAEVSTVFLGSDHNWQRSGPPVLWETLVFGGLLDGEMERYTSREDAVRGHEAMVARVRTAQGD